MTSVIVISLLQFGQISIVGTTEHASLMLMMFPFARRNVGASEKAHPGVGACQSEKQELRTGPVALRQRLDRQHCAPIICKSREKMTAAVRACRRAGTRLQLLAFRSRSPRPGRLPWCLKAWRTVHRSCWSSLAPSVTSAISKSDSNIDVPLARRVRAASITSAR